MNRRSGLVLVGMVLLGVGSCASTEFKSTWKDPEAGPVELQGKRVAAFAVTKDEAMARGAEDAMVSALAKQGVKGIPGYQLLSGDDATDKEKLKDKLKEANVDGAVVMRVVGSRQEVNYVPTGPAYGSFYGYWDYGWSAVGSPGYLTTDRIVSVETLVYSVPRDKLIWAGVSETFEPGKVDKVTKEIVEKATKEMKKDGLIGSH
jgi:hypothetical protein